MMGAQSLSCVRLLETPWTVHGIFPGKNTGVGCYFLLQRDLPNPEIAPPSLASPALAGGFFTHCAIWEASLGIDWVPSLSGQRPLSPWTAALRRLACPLSWLFLSVADKEPSATLRPTSGPACMGPIQLEAPVGLEPWPRPQLSFCSLGLGPSLMVHTPSLLEFP